MKTKIKNLRVKIDGLSQLTKELKSINIKDENGYFSDGFNSKEIEKSYDSLILAKAWLGKVLGELGQETPYKNDGKRKTVEDIEETADTARQDVPTPFDGTKSHIEKIDWLREEIKKIWDVVMEPNFHTIKYSDNDMSDMYWENFYTHLSEARFWLGFELSRCRDEN